MNSPENAERGVFQLEGMTYDLSHLEFKTYEWGIELKNKVRKAIKVDVFFSCHCFSRSPKEGEVYSPAQVVMDHKKERLFDLTRYEQSLALPEIVASLPEHKVFHTGFHNLVRIAAANRLGVSTDYYVFLALSREGKRMRMVVESAYTADLIQDRKKYDKPIRFLVALRNCYERR